MNKLAFGKTLLACLFFLPGSVMAGADGNVRISLPPPIVFPAPPALVVVPETYVYVVPDTDVDIFYYDGWWWRPWEGRWYRSQDYNTGWRHYKGVPSFHGQVPPGWRNDYRQRRWKGHEWDHRPIPHEQVRRNWSGWKKDKHWEKQNSWGVRELRGPSQRPSPAVQQQPPRPQRQQERNVREPVRRQQPQPQMQERDKQQQRPQQQQQPQKRHPQPQKQRNDQDRGREDKDDRNHRNR